MATLDHLVVLAPSLASGVAWAEATLGVTPGPGGEHPLMGTHNRLLRLRSSNDEPGAAYLEIIAINPAATPTLQPPESRWFDMDDPALSERVAQMGPQLVHWVARVPALAVALQAWQQLGIARGEARAASRNTPAGLLQWQISLRPDGQRLFDGCLPTLIEWGPHHPTAAMPDSGLALQSLTLQHPQAALLQAACQTIGLDEVLISEGPARLSAQLTTPGGPLTLYS
ncbi:glyoxalase [Comamonadaceae bacterium]|nr:glyoxalase [Comamonadaceae bacterium]